METFALLMTLAAVAIPIVIVAKILRRLREMSSGVGDPARVQRVFAQSAAAALRRVGGDPQAIAKIEGLVQRALPRALDEPALPTVERPRATAEPVPHRPLRLRTRQQPIAPLGGLDLGDRFRLSEPPDISEPQGPAAFGGSWIAIVALLAGGACYFLR